MPSDPAGEPPQGNGERRARGGEQRGVQREGTETPPPSRGRPVSLRGTVGAKVGRKCRCSYRGFLEGFSGRAGEWAPALSPSHRSPEPHPAPPQHSHWVAGACAQPDWPALPHGPERCPPLSAASAVPRTSPCCSRLPRTGSSLPWAPRPPAHPELCHQAPTWGDGCLRIRVSQAFGGMCHITGAPGGSCLWSRGARLLLM